MSESTATQTDLSPPPLGAAPPAIAPYMEVPRNPPHSSTESTLAPTSEFVRYFLLAWPARYIFRGAFNSLFDKDAGAAMQRTAGKITDIIHPSTRGVDRHSEARQSAMRNANGIALDASFGVGSLALTASYSHMVYRDMFNLFSETVAFEKGKDPSGVSFKDLQASNNKIVQKTLSNWYYKSAIRFGTDALFFARPLIRMAHWGDVVLGIKGLQLFTETWKLEPSLFEHISALVNNKINPKNGLGQPLSTSDTFDLYQHYHFQFSPEKAFTNVIDNDRREARTWATAKPVFDRITELMNLTYSYKHATRIDEATGQPVREANFALPKFLYLLGQDMIDPERPARTLLFIEIANRVGIEGVKEAKQMLDNGTDFNTVLSRYPVTIDLTRNPVRELAPTASKSGTRPTADHAAPSLQIARPEAALQGTLQPSPSAMQERT